MSSCSNIGLLELDSKSTKSLLIIPLQSLSDQKTFVGEGPLFHGTYTSSINVCDVPLYTSIQTTP